ncbi:AlpA family phage regulatory protein [Thioalkalivibrio sp. ALE19]|uniref:helix-turn-helix transcriptional regulator n=1 Tax=Thioalkalivibrio sp. ALE19 TaxID=1266909 RepID=UPI0006856311
MSNATPQTAALADRNAPLKHHSTPPAGQPFLSIPQVCQRYGIHRATAYRWMQERSFPRPVRFSASCARVPLDEIEAWEQAQRSVRG